MIYLLASTLVAGVALAVIVVLVEEHRYAKRIRRAEKANHERLIKYASRLEAQLKRKKRDGV